MIDTKSVVVFESNQFDLSWPEDDSDPNYPPLGEDLARYIWERLKSLDNVEVALHGPDEGETGWQLSFSIDEQSYLADLHWAPVGADADDAWVIQLRKDLSWFRALFGSEAPQREIGPAAEIFDEVLQEAPVEDVRWLTQQEFAEVY